MKGKRVEIFDDWEQFTIKFSVNYDLDNDFYNLRINGSREELGNWSEGTGPIVMDRCESPRWFQPNKYGQMVRPWEVFIRLKNDLSDNNCSFKYNYSIRRESLNDESSEWEREPARSLTILKPQGYQG